MVLHGRGGGGDGSPDAARAALPGFAEGGAGRGRRGLRLRHPGPVAGATPRMLQPPQAPPHHPSPSSSGARRLLDKPHRRGPQEVGVDAGPPPHLCDWSPTVQWHQQPFR